MSWLITRDDPAYPRALANLPRPPATLWLRGSADALRAGASRVAIVGARGATFAKVALARRLASELADEHVIVSGGALGIDGAAHHGARDGGGETVVVLGSGIDVLYPARHQALFEAIAGGGAGALLSIFPPGTKPRRWTFPARNAVIAALARCVIVVEAGPRSGSLQTARLAGELGRPVAAVAGSAGTARLIARGAAPIESAADVRALLAAWAASARAPSGGVACEAPDRARGTLRGGPAHGAAVRAVDDADARALLDALARAGGADCRVMALAAATGLSPARAASVLLRLELAGRVEALPGARYRAL